MILCVSTASLTFYMWIKNSYRYNALYSISKWDVINFRNVAVKYYTTGTTGTGISDNPCVTLTVAAETDETMFDQLSVNAYRRVREMRNC